MAVNWRKLSVVRSSAFFFFLLLDLVIFDFIERGLCVCFFAHVQCALLRNVRVQVHYVAPYMIIS